MKTIKVTSRGRITLPREFLDHLGAAPGDTIRAEKTGDGRLVLSARPTGHISAIFGSLKGVSDRVLSIEEIAEITAESWAGFAR